MSLDPAPVVQLHLVLAVGSAGGMNPHRAHTGPDGSAGLLERIGEDRGVPRMVAGQIRGFDSTMVTGP